MSRSFLSACSCCCRRVRTVGTSALPFERFVFCWHTQRIRNFVVVVAVVFFSGLCVHIKAVNKCTATARMAAPGLLPVLGRSPEHDLLLTASRAEAPVLGKG